MLTALDRLANKLEINNKTFDQFYDCICEVFDEIDHTHEFTLSSKVQRKFLEKTKGVVKAVNFDQHDTSVMPIDNGGKL